MRPWSPLNVNRHVRAFYENNSWPRQKGRCKPSWRSCASFSMPSGEMLKSNSDRRVEVPQTFGRTLDNEESISGEPIVCCFQRRFRFALRRPHLFGPSRRACLLFIDTLSQGEGTWQVLRQLLIPGSVKESPGGPVHKSIPRYFTNVTATLDAMGARFRGARAATPGRRGGAGRRSACRWAAWRVTARRAWSRRGAMRG